MLSQDNPDEEMDHQGHRGYCSYGEGDCAHWLYRVEIENRVRDSGGHEDEAVDDKGGGGEIGCHVNPAEN